MRMRNKKKKIIPIMLYVMMYVQPVASMPSSGSFFGEADFFLAK